MAVWATTRGTVGKVGRRRGTNVWRSGEGQQAWHFIRKRCLLPLTNLGLPSVFLPICQNLSSHAVFGSNLGPNLGPNCTCPRGPGQRPPWHHSREHIPSTATYHISIVLPSILCRQRFPLPLSFFSSSLNSKGKGDGDATASHQSSQPACSRVFFTSILILFSFYSDSLLHPLHLHVFCFLSSHLLRQLVFLCRCPAYCQVESSIDLPIPRILAIDTLSSLPSSPPQNIVDTSHASLA